MSEPEYRRQNAHHRRLSVRMCIATMATPDGSADPIESAMELVGRPEQLRGQTLYAGVELGIIDSLDADAKSAAELSTSLDLPEASARRLLRALDVYGVLDVVDDRYRLTAVGERFLEDHPESVRDYLLFFYNPTRFAAVRHLPDIVAQGDTTGYELEFGKSMFEMFDEDPEFSEQFNGMQDLSSLGETERILDALAAIDFSRFDAICDVGGGYGELLCRILDRHEHLEGSVLELPSVLADEHRLWAPELGVEDRCEYVPGDMFESVPSADAYLLKAILHDWPDADCVRILSTVRDAAPADGRLFVRERLVSEPDPDPATIDMDIWMLLETGGRERTRAEYEDLFERAGWRLTEVLALDEASAIMVCRPQ